MDETIEKEILAQIEAIHVDIIDIKEKLIDIENRFDEKVKK